MDYSCLAAIFHIPKWTYKAILQKGTVYHKVSSDQYVLDTVIRNIYQNDTIMQLLIFGCFSDSSGHIVGDEGKNKG